MNGLPRFLANGTVKAEKEHDYYDNIRNTPSPQKANGAVISAGGSMSSLA